MDRQRSLAGYSPWGCKESDTTEGLTLSFQPSGAKNPVYSHLESLQGVPSGRLWQVTGGRRPASTLNPLMAHHCDHCSMMTRPLQHPFFTSMAGNILSERLTERVSFDF